MCENLEKLVSYMALTRKSFTTKHIMNIIYQAANPLPHLKKVRHNSLLVVQGIEDKIVELGHGLALAKVHHNLDD